MAEYLIGKLGGLVLGSFQTAGGVFLLLGDTIRSMFR